MASIKESDLFPPVKTLFEAEGYTVYSEVEAWEGRADVVAVNGPLIVVVELKATMSLDLLYQGHRWRPYAHQVYVAIPRPKRRNWYAEYILRQEGIGLIEVEYGGATLNWNIPARLNRKPGDVLRKALREEQRFGPPGGSAGGGYVTDYRLTMDRVRDFLRWKTWDGEWVTVAEILEHVHTHYATPKRSLARALLTIEKDWCESKRENGKLWFRRKNEPPKPARQPGA